MVKLNIDGQQYNLQGELTIDQWKSIARWNLEDFKQWPLVIQTVTDLDLDIINQMDLEQQRLAVTMIAWSMQQREPIKLPVLDELNFGQFIDIEYYIAMGPQKSIDSIMRVLDIETDKSAEALYAFEMYSKWRQNIYQRYTALFGGEGTDSEDDGPKQSPEQIAKSWYRILVDLANGDLLKVDGITDEGVKKVFNFMAVQKERNLEELKRAKAKQYELQRSRR